MDPLAALLEHAKLECVSLNVKAALGCVTVNPVALDAPLTSVTVTV